MVEGKKAPNPVDKAVGARVRMRRLLAGMSQEKLADAIGITFQQVQKYEKGTNRIGASRLQQIAEALSESVSYFFQDAPGNSSSGFSEQSSDYVADFLSTTDGLALTRAFMRIHDARVRKRVVDLVVTLGDVEAAQS